MSSVTTSREVQIARVVDVAQGEVSRKSAEHPPGSNLTKYGKWYGVNGVPWCAIGICWVFAMAGLSFGIHAPRTAWVPDYRAWGRARGRWSPGKSDVRVGDIVTFRGGKHVELVVRVVGRRFWTVGFNTSWKGQGGSFANGIYVAENERTNDAVDGTLHPFYGVTEGMVELAQRTVGVTVDGDLGPATMAAVKAWQREHGLEADGIPGPDTYAAMAGVPAVIEGEKVEAPAPEKPAAPVRVPVNGRYDQVTHREVQRRLGRPVDGRLGEGDLAALCDLLGLPKYDEISDQPRTAAEVGDAIVPRIWDYDPDHKGPNSVLVRALEAYSGATVDRGSWGPGLTTRIQVMLNEHPGFMTAADKGIAAQRIAKAGVR